MTAHHSRIAGLERAIADGRIDRRTVIARGLGLGLSTSLILDLASRAPHAAAAPGAGGRPAPFALQAGEPRRFTFVRDDSIPDLDPYWDYNEGAGGINLAAYENLIQYRDSTTDEYVGVLAREWSVSEDGASYTFALHPDVRFHSGDPLTAQTVKDAYARVLGIGRSISGVLSRFVQDPEQIVVVDDATVRFDLGRPQPLFLPALASAFGTWIVNPRHVAEHRTDEDPWAHEWYRENIDGSGPWRLREFSLDEVIILERNPDYREPWDDGQFEEVVLRFVPEVTVRQQLIEQGEIDATTNNLTPEMLDGLSRNPGLDVFTYESTLASWVSMNAVRLSKEARIGFSWAFPYDDVVDGAYKGLLKRSGPVPTTLRGYDPGEFLYQTDLGRAKEALAQAGHAEGETFEYVIEAGNPIEEVVALLFQANLQAIGYNLDVATLDSPTFVSVRYSDAPGEEIPHFLGGTGWWPDYNDPWNQLYPSFVKASIGSGNCSYWVNDRFEELMAEAAAYEDEAQLGTIMKEALNILIEQDPPAIYYGTRLWYTVLRNDIDGFGWNPLYLSSYHPLRDLRRLPA
ncbi:MAG: ABC transporter substrate-binding protein [Chloroflexota bacterium]